MCEIEVFREEKGNISGFKQWRQAKRAKTDKRRSMTKKKVIRKFPR